ncbi:MAG: ABC transporter ATP-binding protein, partial [Pseudomonadota bacterium]
MTKHPLTLSGLVRTYGGTDVVSDVSLVLAPGQVTALLGPSGAGKSTLLRLLAGLERPDAGTLRSGDTILSSPDTMVPAEKRRIGLIFQDFALFPHLTALENVKFGLTNRRSNEASQTASDWLDRVGLSKRAHAYPHELSGGEQQRVAIARALAPDPVAILMDEPFSGLDPALRDDVRGLALRQIRETNIPALLVTHDADEAMLFADQIAVMRAGKIRQTGTPDEVYRRPNDAETAAALGAFNLIRGQVDAGGHVSTPFGDLTPPQPVIGPSVSLGVRPEGIQLSTTSSAKATIKSVRRQGPLWRLIIASGGVEATIVLSTQTGVTIGDTVGVALDPDHT